MIQQKFGMSFWSDNKGNCLERQGIMLLVLVMLWFEIIPVLATEKTVAQSGVVRITFGFNRISSIASNQFAVWIEDEEGQYIKTLAATGFTAQEGFASRPDSLREWVKVSDWAKRHDQEVDAVSSATPQSGVISFDWDGADSSGTPVPDGKYVYRVEANNSWDQRVIWTGAITIGSQPDSSEAVAAFFPDEKTATSKGLLVTNVNASFEP